MQGDAARIALPLAITFAIQMLTALAVFCAPVMAPVAAPAMGVAPSAIGYFITASYLGAMIGTSFAGGTVARLGPIRVSQLGLALCLAGLACSAIGIAALVLLGAFIVGLGYGPSTPTSSVILARAAPPRMLAMTFSIKQTGVPVGAALAGALVPAMVLTVGWQGAALAIGFACLALAFAISPQRARFDADRDPSAPISVRAAFGPVKLVATTRRLRETAVTGFVFGGAQVALLAYLVTFLTESLGMSLVLAGLVLSVSQIASVAGRIGWGVAADRLLPQRAMLGMLGLGMGASCVAALAVSPEWPRWLLFAYAAVFGATALGWNGVWLAELARQAPPGKVGEATGGSLFFTFLGVLLTPLVFNAVLALAGSYAIAYAAMGVPSLAVGARLLLWRRA